MDPNFESQIDALRQRQTHIRHELHQLSEQCEQLDHDLEKLQDSPTQEVAPPPLPYDFIQQRDDANKVSSIPEQKIPSSFSAPTPEPQSPTPKQVGPSTPAPEAAPKKSKPSMTVGQSVGEWELNFGQVWLVRIGIIFLLTGLIFLSTYAYKNWLFHSGPVVKVAFFMVVSLSLTGTGLWLEKWKLRFQQYGRVVVSGGLAAGYYTLYAAHFTPSLKIIHSPVLAGGLLTLWAGVMLAYAVWKQSRVVAVMAIGLAFYGTVVNPAGGLSLFSALLLSSAGMWLLLKFRWVGIGLGTVIAAYTAHAFWLGFCPHSVADPIRFTYLACYWLLFTTALAVPQARSLPQFVQRAFCAINNSAAWALTVFLIPDFTAHSEIGWISIGIGCLWITVASAIRFFPGKMVWPPALCVIFGYQGILVLSLGILLQATGYTRFLVMAVEACVLLAGARYFGGWLARVASAAAFACALLTALPFFTDTLPGWPSYAALSLIFATYTALVHRDAKNQMTMTGIALIPAAATWAIVSWGVFGQWQPTAAINGIWITSTTLMLIYFFSKKPTWLADMAMLSIFPALGAGWWFLFPVHSMGILPSLIPVIGAGAFWFMSPRLVSDWDRQMNNQEKPGGTGLEWVFSLMMWLMLIKVVSDHIPSFSNWMFIGGLLALIGHAFSNLTQRRSLGAPAVMLHAFALLALIDDGNFEPALGWIPASLILLHLALCDRYWSILNQRAMRIVLSLALVLTTAIHAFQELARPDILLTGLGVGLMVWSYLRNNRTIAMAGAIPAFLIACLSALFIHGHQDWGRYLPIITMMLVHGWLWFKRSSDNAVLDLWLAPRSILLGTALLCLFAVSSQHVRASFEGSGLSICWALTASLLFTLGLVMRCRPYRLVGLTWLALAVVHVIGIDVMRLGTLGRILSFITLGIVLLILGFLYNRFQETIRKFL